MPQPEYIMITETMQWPGPDVVSLWKRKQIASANIMLQSSAQQQIATQCDRH